MQKSTCQGMLLAALAAFYSEAPLWAQDSAADCVSTRIRCVDDSSGPSQEYKTIQACAQVAVAGDTCLVFPGSYPEHVSTVNAGTEASPITYKALQAATNPAIQPAQRSVVKGFRIQDPFVQIEGFDITKYDVGVLWGHLTVEPTGDNCVLRNNVIHDGIYLTSFEYFFDASSKTITNAAGGFVAAGFAPGAKIYLASNINEQIKNHDTIKTVVSVTDTQLTVADVQSSAANWQLQTEGPVNSTIYVTRSDKMGVTGIHFNISSSTGTADNCRVTGNHFYNLAGGGVNISGSNHLVERNRWQRMNGWRMLTLSSSDSVFRYNIFEDSPRWPGFPAPLPGVVHSPGTGTWDMFAAWLYSSPSKTNPIRNNRFEFNILKDIDNSGGQLELTLAGGEASGLSFYGNVFVGVESAGAFHYPETKFVNNTFFRSAIESGSNINLLGNDRHGIPYGSVISHNAFVGNNKDPDPAGQYGWYVATTDVFASPPNYNFVAGSSVEGYPAQAGFSGIELQGLNGGDPKFYNIDQIVGPDGLAFSADDGLQPLPGSALCAAGQGGTHVGAYRCKSVGNQHPLVYIAQPTPFTTFAPGTQVAVVVSATDHDGAIAKVELFVNLQKQAQASAAPYLFTLGNLPLGTHTLVARVTDSAGASADSLAVAVQIAASGQQPAPPGNLLIVP